MPASWTNPPRTWVDGEIVTASIGNTHWRDQLMYLKEQIDLALLNSGPILAGGGSALTALANGDNDNVTLGSVAVLLLNCAAGTCVVTGLTGGVAGRLAYLMNVGASGTFETAAEDAGSTDTNRFLIATSAMPIGRGLPFIYIGGSINRWALAA